MLFLPADSKLIPKFWSFVSDSPEPQIQLGKSLNPNSIREGSDVYFDCIVNAQPPVYKVEWRHNVSFEDAAVDVCAKSDSVRFAFSKRISELT